jgi:uncharacterized protein involved in response to NO
MQRLLPLEGALPEPTSRSRWAVGAKGFRPFFLLSAIFATAVVPLWLLVLSGLATAPGHLDATSWHAHEMVLGYAVGVIAGFLLTAVGNWTRRETLVGLPLLGLAALWALGRVVMFFASVLPHVLVAFVDLAFLPVLVVVLARPLFAARDRRNYGMLGILGALFAANLVIHLAALGVVGMHAARDGALFAIDVVVLVVLVIAGRVFPMFTRNATGVTTIRSSRSLDVLTVGAMAVLAGVDALAPAPAAGNVVAGVVGLLAIARAARWGTRHTARHPLLWILHAGYAWLALGLVLRALAGIVPAVPASLATHALTVGAIGSLTLGMMARVSLGHSGRPLVAPRPAAWAFGAITASAVLRVLAPLFAPRAYFAELVAAGGFWTLAFALYLVAYAGVLVSPRIDGRAG